MSIDAEQTILVRESNVISLRTAYVIDDGHQPSFLFPPVDLLEWGARRNRHLLGRNIVRLYRYSLSPSAKRKLHRCEVNLNLRVMTFQKPPQFRLVWTD